MTQAHIAALLPTQNRVVSADENTAFLAHYDLNEHDVLRNVKALGYDKVLELATGYISTPNIDVSIFKGPFTVETWVNLNSVTGDNPIFGIGAGVANQYLHLVVRSGKPYLGFYAPDLASTTTLSVGTWYHLAFVYDGTKQIIYINGAQDIASGTVAAFGGTVSNGRIGFYSSANFNGKMKDFRIYARAKTEAEIKDSMNNVSLSEQGLRAYYKLNDNDTILRDSSPFHNDSTATGTLNWIKDSNSVFTLREGEGYFGGGALAVEESTTNIVPNPTVNSYPSVGNGWGTYQTNQYNSGNFFSIGTITSVINNEVTVSWAAGVKFRTYDVLRPQTTGGGLTANTDYFIKMTSDTTFTIHQYDSSSDGSKGFAVHDNIRRDIRIPINATSFPTMWYGAAHKANSGLVKEIIRNGFSNNGVVHDCLRLYTNYADQTQAWGDYMAYGVTPTINANTQYAVSFYYRAVTPETVGRVVNYQMHNGVGFGYGTFTLQRDWQRYEAVVTSTATGGASMYWNAGKGVVWDIAEIQVEQKAFATSFTTGTRPESKVFYPTKDVLNPEAGTINMWVKFRNLPNSATGWRMLFVTKDGGVTSGTETNQISFRIYNSWDSIRLTTGGTSAGTIGTATVTEGWHMLTATWDRSAPFVKFYVDGVLIGQSTNIAYIPSAFHEHFYLGRWTAGETYNANHLYDELRIDKVARTDAEIAAWYYSNGPFWPRGIYRKPY